MTVVNQKCSPLFGSVYFGCPLLNAIKARCGFGIDYSPPHPATCLIIALVFSILAAHGAAMPQESDSVKVEHQIAMWKNGPANDEFFFPVGVWLQSPKNAERYKAAGINLYVGLWKGPTSEQLAGLRKADMPVICSQNEVGLVNKEGAKIVGWMHGDEPDNAQSLGKGKGYGPPIPPDKIVADYAQIRANDATRPVLLNLGQGTAWDQWKGRGERCNHPEDYPAYIKGGDILSFDIYPVTHISPDVAGKLEFVGRGVERLMGWAEGKKTVWSCIECTHVSNPTVRPTAQQVRSEVWMAIIRGASGLIYFVHEFKPAFKEAALLDDAEMLAAVRAINTQVRELAPVLNRPTIVDGVSVKPTAEKAVIAVMMKQRDAKTYLFAVNMGNQPAKGIFVLRADVKAGKSAEVRYEARSLPISEGQFADEFAPYQVHIYELPTGK